MLCFLTASLFTTCRTHKESDISGIYKKNLLGTRPPILNLYNCLMTVLLALLLPMKSTLLWTI